MIWKKETPVVLYGAAYLGGVVYDYLHTKTNIVAFIDKRADEILNYRDLPVYSINTPFTQTDKDGMIVLIAVKNVFDHRKIARQLKEQGFSFIIDFSHPDFSKIMENTFTLPVTVDPYKSTMIYNWQDSAFILHNDGYVTARIPTPLVFTNIGGKQDFWADWPIQSLYPHEELFSFFDGNMNSNPYCYVEEYCIAGANRIGNKHITDRWKQNVLESRQKVFYNMEQNWQLKTSFFIDNAPTAAWSNGKFNLTSGKHRAAFLASKGEHFIPLKVTEQNYQAFLNMESARETMNFIEHEQMEDTLFSIPHPYFYAFASQSGFAFYIILRKMLLQLGHVFLAKGHSLSELSVLCCSKHYAAFGRYFAQIGAKVKHAAYSGLDRLLDQLQGVTDISDELCTYDLIIAGQKEWVQFDSFALTAHVFLLFSNDPIEIQKTFVSNTFSLENLCTFSDSGNEKWAVLVTKKEENR